MVFIITVSPWNCHWSFYNIIRFSSDSHFGRTGNSSCC